ncbi:MAG: adenosine kinase [Magnetococcales bacterium]|nr:adenosine kinase [Magnetococcales bacterium]
MTPLYHVYGVGHALVDMELEVGDAFLQRMRLEKGSMTLVDAPRQEELLAALSAIPARRSCGGSAANTMIAMAQLGGRAFHSCQVAADEAGRFFAQDLRANGVDNLLGAVAPEGDAGVTGRCLVFITPDAERTMCTHLGVSERITPAALVPDRLAAAACLYVEGYLISAPTALATALEAVALARKAGARVAVTFSDVSMVRYFRSGLEALVAGGVDLIFCNENEAREFTGSDDVDDALRRLRGLSRAVVVTRGRHGALVDDGAGLIRVPGQAVQPVDTNGAGDLFAGAYLYGITHGMGAAMAAHLACRAAAVLVTRFGARLEADQTRAVLHAFRQDSA